MPGRSPSAVDGDLHLARHGVVEAVAVADEEAVGVAAPAAEPGQEELRRPVVVEGDRLPVVLRAAAQPEPGAEAQPSEPGLLEHQHLGGPHHLEQVTLHVDLAAQVGLGEPEVIARSERRQRRLAAEAHDGPTRIASAAQQALRPGRAR